MTRALAAKLYTVAGLAALVVALVLAKPLPSASVALLVVAAFLCMAGAEMS